MQTESKMNSFGSKINIDILDLDKLLFNFLHLSSL